MPQCFENIPFELKGYPQWVNWKYEDYKRSKVLYSPHSFMHASVSDPMTWGTYNKVIEVLPHFDGIGFVFTAGDPYCVIDLDQPKDKLGAYYEDERINEIQLDIFRKLNSYSERSPSGRGLHIICKAAVPSGRKTKEVEIYSSRRFITMTGDTVLNEPIKELQVEISQLWEQVSPRAMIIGADYNEPQTFDDRIVYEMAVGASNGDKFYKLWQGDFLACGYGHSEADFAMIDILAFYTRNREQIKRLFRMCGLGKREKAQREDYVENMITKSFDRTIAPVNFDELRENLSRLNEQALIVPKYEKQISLRAEHIRDEIKLENQKNIDLVEVSEFKHELPTGLTGMIAKFIYDQARKPIEAVAIVGAIGLMAGIAGKAYNVGGTGLNQYMILLARTGRGKEAMASGISKLMATLEPMLPFVREFIGPSHFASGQSLLKDMADHRYRSYVSIIGEYGKKLQAMTSPRATGAEQILSAVLLDMYTKSGAADAVNPMVYSDKNKNTPVVMAPSLSLICESQPAIFYNAINQDMVISGLLSRFCTVEYMGDRPESNYNAEFVIPDQQLIQMMSNLITTVYRLLEGKRPYNIPFDQRGEHLSKEYEKRCDKLINDLGDNILGELWNRAHLKAVRIAGLLAVGNHPNNPIIDEYCMNWAINFVNDGTEKLLHQFATGAIAAMTDEEIQLRLVRTALAKYIITTSYENSMNLAGITNAMFDCKIVSYGYLSKALYQNKAFKNDKLGSSIAIKRSLNSLEEMGELIKIPKHEANARFNSSGNMWAIQSEQVYKICRDILGTNTTPGT